MELRQLVKIAAVSVCLKLLVHVHAGFSLLKRSKA